MTAPSTRLRRLLSGASGPGGPFDPATLLSLDDDETFPADACALLDQFGLGRYYLPGDAGLLDNFAELIRLVGTVAHHDLTIAVAHAKTFLGVVSIWVAGSQAQLRRWGSELARGSIVSWGLTERGHGSDLLAGQLRASRAEDGGWYLDGEKWAINNATRGDAICVLAKTSDRGGANGFSLLLVDKRDVPAGRCTRLPKLRTYGIRGADISGISFHGAKVPAGSLVGREGAGLPTVLKALQLTRIATAALSLGAIRHAVDVLRTLIRNAEATSDTLVSGTGALCVAGRTMATANVVDAVSAVAARSVHALPGELSVISAVTKALVPSLVDEMLLEISEVVTDLDGRHDSLPVRAFRKLERDHRIVAIFDGSTTISRQALIAQFPVLARSYAAGKVDQNGLTATVSLDEPPGSFHLDRLEMLSRNGCSLVQAGRDTVRHVREVAARRGLPPGCVDLVDRASELIEDVTAKIAGYRPRLQAPMQAFDLAAAYELGFAAIACMRVWLASSGRLRPIWLHSVLALLVSRWGDACVEDFIFEELARAAENGDLIAGAAGTVAP